MENKDLQNEIVNAAAEKAAAATNEALETKTIEINEQLETKANAEEVTKLAGVVDKLTEKMNNASFGITKSRTPKQEMAEYTKNEITKLRKGQNVVVNSEDFGLSMKDLDINDGADNYAAYRDNGPSDIKYDPNHQTRLTNFVSMYNLPDTGAIRYNQEELGFTDDSGSLPAPKAVGAAGAAGNPEIQPVTEAANTIFGSLTVPNEWVSEINGMNDYVSRRLMGHLLDVVDQQILAGSGSGNNWSGIDSFVVTASDLDTEAKADAYFSQDGTIADANNFDVFTAVAAELEGDNFRPDTVILNPVDYRLLSTIKSNQAEYVANQAMVNASPWSYFAGLRIVPNAAQTAGEFTLFDSSAVGVFTSKGVSFEYGLNDNDFISNNITARAMIRGGVAGFRPNGITIGHLDHCRASLASA